MIVLEHPDTLFVKGCRYVALKSFNGGMPTHDFIENEIYIYIAFDMLGAEFIALNRGFFWYKNKRNNNFGVQKLGRNRPLE